MAEEKDPPPARRPGRKKARRRQRVDSGRRTVFGDERRIGLWIVPLLLITALIGAVLTGALAVLYYSQQVDALDEEIDVLREALDEVEGGAASLPASAEAEEDDEDDGAADVRGERDPEAVGIVTVVRTRSDGAVEVGNAFTFFSDAGQSFLVTDGALVDSFGPGEGLEIVLRQGIFAADLLGVDAELSLASLRIDVGDLPVLRWRDPAAPIEPGEPVAVLGIAGPSTPVRVTGEVASVETRAVVAAVPISANLAGAPLLDSAGEVVAVVTPRYEPAGVGSSGLVWMPPIRALCVSLVDCAPEDLGPGGPLPQGPSDVPGAVAVPAPPAPAPVSPPAVPAPAPVPTAVPSSTPEPAPSAPPQDTEPAAEDQSAPPVQDGASPRPDG